MFWCVFSFSRLPLFAESVWSQEPVNFVISPEGSAKKLHDAACACVVVTVAIDATAVTKSANRSIFEIID